MRNLELFNKESGLLNASILECEKGFVGVAQRFGTRLIHGKTRLQSQCYLFGLNISYELEYLKRVPIMEDVHLYTTFTARNNRYILGYSRGECRLFIIEKDEVRYIKKLGTSKLIHPKDGSYSTNNFTPLDNCRFVYSFNPFRIIELQSDEFVETANFGDVIGLPYNLHGGTRFVKFNNKEYIGALHYYTGVRRRIYNIYLLTLSIKYPHLPKRRSSKAVLNSDSIPAGLDIGNSSFWLDSGAKVVVEKGIVNCNGNIVISYGMQDRTSNLLIMSNEEADRLLEIEL